MLAFLFACIQLVSINTYSTSILAIRYLYEIDAVDVPLHLQKIPISTL